jgi:tetratricopeptide (TPR) repeat protein
MRVEKTVFISYRRTNVAWALAVYQYLSKNGYDVFFDFTSINNGDFEQIIIGNIKSRAHFLLILTPSALERVNEPNDWLRREIETALGEKRNIVPLMLEGFDYGSPAIAKYLTGKLSKYNAVRVPIDFFEEAMARICNNYLDTPLDLVLHPASAQAQAAAAEEKKAANKEVTVAQKELTAQEWFEKALKDVENKSFEEALKSCDKAIQIEPSFAEAYNRRGYIFYTLEKLDRAIKDFNEAIRLKPNYPDAYFNRAISRAGKRDYQAAIKDYNEAIRLNPIDDDAYYSRGAAYWNLRDSHKAIEDWEMTLKLKPNHKLANEWIFKARKKLR